MQVKGCKDITGQEFVFEVIEFNSSKIIIKNPIVYVPTENGVIPVPYIMTSKDIFEINIDKIICGPYNIVENIENSYKQMFGGITQPNKQLVLP